MRWSTLPICQRMWRKTVRETFARRLSSLTSGLIEEANSDEAQDPLVILVFDEAHILTKKKTEFDRANRRTNFGELRKALRNLNIVSLFSFFLSTTGKITQFVPSRDKDESMRVVAGELELIQLFIDLGFDQLVNKLRKGAQKLTEVTKEEFMVQFGRPL